MARYVLHRALQAIPVLLLGSITIWAFVYLLPGSPAVVLAGDLATPDEIAAIERRLGLDQPVVVQYVTWFTHALTGDFGTSFISGQTVADLLLGRLPATIQLAGISMVFGLVLAVPLGLVSALRSKSLAGVAADAYMNIGLAVPTFWLGLLLILAFSVSLRLFPSASDFVPFWEDPGRALLHAFLPAATLAIHISSVVGRFIRTSLRETLSSDFIRTARSKGVPEDSVVARHAIPNAMLPVVTIVGLQLGTYLGGTVVTEVVFSYPGLGRLIYDAVGQRDYAVVQGGVLFVLCVFLIVNLVVDVLYAALDPRIRAAI